MFLTQVVEKLKTHFMFSDLFFRKSCRIRDKVGKYGIAGQATDYKIMRHVRIVCWITKATDTHSEYVIIIAFHG